MPIYFQNPRRRDEVVNGLTNYRVLVSPTNSSPSALFADGQSGPRLSEIVDGTHSTILIAEGPETPWTSTDELVFNPNGEIPILGGIFSRGFNAAMADGSVRFFGYATTAEQIKAMVTSNGGERVAIDD